MLNLKSTKQRCKKFRFLFFNLRLRRNDRSHDGAMEMVRGSVRIVATMEQLRWREGRFFCIVKFVRLVVNLQKRKSNKNRGISLVPKMAN